MPNSTSSGQSQLTREEKRAKFKRYLDSLPEEKRTFLLKIAFCPGKIKVVNMIVKTMLALSRFSLLGFSDRLLEEKKKAHEAAVAERKKLKIRMSPRNPEKRPKNYTCPTCHHKDERIAEVWFMMFSGRAIYKNLSRGAGRSISTGAKYPLKYEFRVLMHLCDNFWNLGVKGEMVKLHFLHPRSVARPLMKLCFLKYLHSYVRRYMYICMFYFIKLYFRLGSIPYDKRRKTRRNCCPKIAGFASSIKVMVLLLLLLFQMEFCTPRYISIPFLSEWRNW